MSTDKPYYSRDGITLYHADCRELLATMEAGSVDAVVTDPPYGLSFMGKKWDYNVPSVEAWVECLRVLKPGAHLLAFAGTRTQHRMAVRIEDAGFEIRDMIAWVYGSGFPKSLDVSKAIDKAAGAEREVIGVDSQKAKQQTSALGTTAYGDFSGNGGDITAPATDAARQWQGWGTAMKPSWESVTYATKPLPDTMERGIILSNLFQLESRLWLLSSASAAEKSSGSSQSEYGEACAIAQWSADEITSTRAALCDPMGMSQFELATNTSLSIVSSWKRILEESWSDGNTFTIGTESSTTTDLKTLRFSLSQITPKSIIQACSLPGGFSVNASTAEIHFNASVLLLQSIRTLSATAPAISLEAENCRGVGAKPNLDPCIVARKPLVGTVAENVLAHGTGALNIDGCRVGTESRPVMVRTQTVVAASSMAGVSTGATSSGEYTTQGRWPANLIHDGSEEVIAGFPNVGKSTGGRIGNKDGGGIYGGGKGLAGEYVKGDPGFGDSGSAARFFYCAKASKRDRGEGNTHPTVKPNELMRYLCRLVTPDAATILDPFAGSCTTGVAAWNLGRKAILCEISEEYCEIGAKRLDRVISQGRLFKPEPVRETQATLEFDE